MTHGYFKPFRRKIGIAMLVLACVFAGAWVRSMVIRDTVFVFDGWLTLSNGVAEFVWFDESKFTPVESGDPKITLLHAPGYPIERRSIPYWPICTPLTLLSAWLLLSKSRAWKMKPADREGSEAMNGYFRPLRRKIGVLTLVMACVLTAVWIRSQVVKDQVSFGHFHESTVWTTQSTGVMGLRSKFSVDVSAPWLWTSEPRPQDDILDPPVFSPLSFHVVIWRHQLFGFDAGAAEFDPVSALINSFTKKVPAGDNTTHVRRFVSPSPNRQTFLFIPYWFIVLPLTLLSAWLLLSKPAKSIQGKVEHSELPI